MSTTQSTTHDEGIFDIFDMIVEARSECEPTMTLRDQFAMAALTGIVSNPNWSNNSLTPQDEARDCYKYADAMIAARERK